MGSFFSIQDLTANANEAQHLEEAVDLLSNPSKIAPSISRKCNQSERKESSQVATAEDAKEKIDSVTISPSILLSFVSEGDSPIKFFIHGRTGIDQNGEPTFQKVSDSRVNLREIDKVMRIISSDNKGLTDLTESELDTFLRENTYLNLDEQEDAKLIMELMQLDSESEILDRVQQASQNYSYDRKVSLLASIGSSFLGGYDYQRIDIKDTASKGVVTLTDLFSSLNTSLRDGENYRSGVCRDMHQAMALMAQKMGLDNAYGVTYRTRTSSHLILTTTPKKYGQVSLINYGRVEKSKDLSGVGALEPQQAMHQWGLPVELSTSHSKTIIQLPTRLAEAIAKASGAEEDDFLYAGNNNATNGIKTGIKTPYGSILVSKESFTKGSPGVVSGVFYQIAKSPISKVHLDGAVGYVDSTKVADGTTLQESGLVVRLNAGISDELKISDRFKIGAKVDFNYLSLSSCRKTSDDPHCVEDSIKIDAAKRARQFSTLKNSDIELSAQYYGDVVDSTLTYKAKVQLLDEDIRNNTTQYRLTIPQHKISLDIETQDRELDIKTYGSLIFTDLTDQVLTTYIAGIRATYNPFDTSITGEISGRIESDGKVTPSWLPGTENRALVRAVTNFPMVSGQLGVEVQGSRDYQGEASGFVIYRIGE